MNILRLFLFVATAALLTTSLGCSSDAPDVLECEGECTCDEEERSCSCHGGTNCVIDGADDITFYCDGNADCDLLCGTGCHVVCPGTTTCEATIGHEGSAECKGTATCQYWCDGDCNIDCGSNTTCTVECHEDCEQEGDNCVC